jgi:Na+/H+ antiporter NhaD/arsenite permease-like protein
MQALRNITVIMIAEIFKIPLKASSTIWAVCQTVGRSDSRERWIWRVDWSCGLFYGDIQEFTV